MSGSSASNRPEGGANALTYTTYAELEQAVRTTTGALPDHHGRRPPRFCSGGRREADPVQDWRRAAGGPASVDAASHTGGPTRLLHTKRAGHRGGQTVPPSGGAWKLALMADIRIASEKAKFGELFVKARHQLRTRPASVALLRSWDGKTASELLFTGRIISGEEAARLRPGVAGSSPHEELMHTAMQAGARNR